MATEKYVYFFGQTTPTAYLSQWYKCEFTDAVYTYSSTEQYMMAQKAFLFSDFETHDKILAATNPAVIKKLGRQVKNFDENVWVENRERIVYSGNLLKFMQNADLKELLLATGDAIIAEASPYDRIWGIGVSARAGLTRSGWEGLNLLGTALMKVREELSK